MKSFHVLAAFLFLSFGISHVHGTTTSSIEWTRILGSEGEGLYIDYIKTEQNSQIDNTTPLFLIHGIDLFGNENAGDSGNSWNEFATFYEKSDALKSRYTLCFLPSPSYRHFHLLIFSISKINFNLNI